MTTPVEELDELTSPLPTWFVDALSVPRAQATCISDGCAINYFEWGDRSNPGIILIHGSRAHARVFAFIAPLLVRDFHVVAYDISGMGDSGTRPSYDIDLRAREVLAVADASGMFEGGRKPFVVGHSFGGIIGTRAMRDYGEHFAGYLHVDVLSLPPDEIGRFLNSNFTPGDVFRIRPNRVYPTLEAALERFALSPAQPCENAFLIEYAARHSVKRVEGGWSWKFDPAVFTGELRDPRWVDDISRDYTALPIRKAFIYGTRSGQFTERSATYFRKISANPGPFIGVTDAYHQLMFDQPQAFADVIASIVKVWLYADRH